MPVPRRPAAAEPPHDPVPPPQGETARTATRSGVVSLLLAGAALVSAPALLLIPYLNLLPALAAASGAVVATVGLRGRPRRTGPAVAGLIASVVLFALLAGLATAWNTFVAGPAVSEYHELHEVLERIRGMVTG